jgi:hypothetical protein
VTRNRVEAPQKILTLKNKFKILACDISLCVNKRKECLWPHNRVFIRRHNLLSNEETVVWTLIFFTFMYKMVKVNR